MSDQDLNINEFEILSKKLTENLDSESINVIIEKLQILKKKYPKDNRIYSLLSLFFNKNKNYEEAIRTSKESIHLFPENSNSYYIMAESFVMINMIDEAINNYKKAISYNTEHYSAYYALGYIMWKQRKIEDAIDNFKKVLEINPRFIQASKINSIIIANKNLKKIDCRFDLNKEISDQSVAKLYQKIQNIIKEVNLKIELEGSQIYRKSLTELNCGRHFEVFNTFNVIPEFCFSCYKVQIEPKNILEMLKLYIVFNNLNLKKNLSRKCMVEYRMNVKGTYKGFIFCSGLKEAENTMNLLSPILNIAIDKQIPRLIKRGCTEFSQAYPKYKELNPKSPQFMKYDEKWRTKEKIIDDKLKAKKLISRKRIESYLGMTLKDALVINNWMYYAKKIGDESIDKVSREIPYSHYMDQLLSEDIVNSLKAN